MSPLSTVRMRRVTALAAIGWALLALVLGVTGRLAGEETPDPPLAPSLVGMRALIHAVGPAAAAAGIQPGDRLLAVEGSGVERWLRGAEGRLVPGRADRYTIQRRDGTRFEASLTPLPPRSGAYPTARLLDTVIPLVGIIYLGIGIFVWRLKPDRAESWAFLLFCCVMANEMFLRREVAGPTLPLTWFVDIANVPLIGATAFHLFTTYPYEPRWIVRQSQLRVFPYLLAGLLAGVFAFDVLFDTGARLALDLGFFSTQAIGVLCLATLAVEWRRRRNDPHASRATAMLLGAVLSFVPVIVFLLGQYFFDLVVPWTVAIVAFSIFPAAVGWGIARRQLFGVRGVARSSTAYGAVTLAITGLFALTITFADALFSRIDVNSRSPVFQVAFLFLAILLFNPVRGRVQRIVDGFFDRDRAAYRRAVREISEAMVSMLSVTEVVDRILVALTDTMGLESAAVLLREDAAAAEPRVGAPGPRAALHTVASRGDWEGEPAARPLSLDHPLCRQLWLRREELARPDFDEEDDPEVREACRDFFDSHEAELVVPILYGTDLLGLIAVGRKLSGDWLGADDRQLLRTLANQSAIAIENAMAFDEIASLNETLEQRVEVRTTELREAQAQLLQSEKMRSLGQLVAGVAHELNNPIGFVHANLRLIDEYVGRLENPELDEPERKRIRAALGKLLSRSREGTSRVKQIVEDLRTFSRTDRGELQEVDVNEELERTLGLVASRIGHGIEVVRDFGDLPRIRCFSGPLNQVFLNLLVNACDAVESSGTIRVRTRAIGDGVRIEIEDDGPGIPPELLSRIFEPFFTTKEVGQGTGLGLSLSHGIVERHGGHLSVTSRLGEGACFVIELPREARPPATVVAVDA